MRWPQVSHATLSNIVGDQTRAKFSRWSQMRLIKIDGLRHSQASIYHFVAQKWNATHHIGIFPAVITRTETVHIHLEKKSNNSYETGVSARIAGIFICFSNTTSTAKEHKKRTLLEDTTSTNKNLLVHWSRPMVVTRKTDIQEITS